MIKLLNDDNLISHITEYLKQNNEFKITNIPYFPKDHGLAYPPYIDYVLKYSNGNIYFRYKKKYSDGRVESKTSENISNINVLLQIVLFNKMRSKYNIDNLSDNLNNIKKLISSVKEYPIYTSKIFIYELLLDIINKNKLMLIQKETPIIKDIIKDIDSFLKKYIKYKKKYLKLKQLTYD
jgi:hypothetical protein